MAPNASHQIYIDRACRYLYVLSSFAICLSKTRTCLLEVPSAYAICFFQARFRFSENVTDTNLFVRYPLQKAGTDVFKSLQKTYLPSLSALMKVLELSYESHICFSCQYVNRLCFQPYQYKFLMNRLFSDLTKEFRNCLYNVS